jgi:hypothetical protein
MAHCFSTLTRGGQAQPSGNKSGRLVGESVVVQSVIYAMMKRDDQGDATKSRDTR